MSGTGPKVERPKSEHVWISDVDFSALACIKQTSMAQLGAKLSTFLREAPRKLHTTVQMLS